MKFPILKWKSDFLLQLFCILLFLPSCFLYGLDTPVARSVGLIIHPDFRGEREFAERVKIAGEKLHWQVHIFDPTSFNNSDCPCDWLLTFVPETQNRNRTDNYLILFDPVNHYFNSEGHLDEKYSNYAGYQNKFY